jgi:hypothetical protein
MKVKEIPGRVKKHVCDNKELYIAMTAASVAGGAFGYLVRGQMAGQMLPEVVTDNKIVNAVCWKPTSTIIEFVEHSTPSKPVHLMGTQQYFDSIHDAARKTGHSVQKISRNVNGYIPSLGKDVFEFVPTA